MKQTRERELLTGLLAGGASAPYERFAAGKTSAQAEFISAEHIKSKGWSRPLGGEVHKKVILTNVLSFRPVLIKKIQALARSKPAAQRRPQTEAQRSGFGLEARSSRMSAR